MSARLIVVVHGEPAPQGSKKAFVNRKTGRANLVEASKKVRPWRQAVQAAALEAVQEVRPGRAAGPLWGPDHPLTVRITFSMKRPRSHYGTGKKANTIKPTAPDYPAVTPDLDKLVRSTLDGLGEAGVWHDDSRVVRLTAVKLYGPIPGAHITVHGPSWGAP